MNDSPPSQGEGNTHVERVNRTRERMEKGKEEREGEGRVEEWMS